MPQHRWVVTWVGCHLDSRTKHSHLLLLRFTIWVQAGGKGEGGGGELQMAVKSSVNVTFLTQNQLRQSDDDKWGKEWIGAPFRELYQLYINLDINTMSLRHFIIHFLPSFVYLYSTDSIKAWTSQSADIFYLVQTAHVSSRCWTYGRQGSEPQ